MFYECFTLIGSWEGGKKFRSGYFRSHMSVMGNVTYRKKDENCIWFECPNHGDFNFETCLNCQAQV